MRKQSTQSTGLAYEQENELTTSGSGARALYLTKLSKNLPGDCFWSQICDTCRQAVRERNVGPLSIFFFEKPFIIVCSNSAKTYGLQSSRPTITDKHGNTKQT